MNDIGFRFEHLIGQLQMNNNSFANSLGKSASNIKQIIDGKNKPGFDMLSLIKQKHPNVNLEWLILGEGEVFLDNRQTTRNNVPELWENLKQSYESTIQDLRYTVKLQSRLLGHQENFHNDIELPPYEVLSEGFIRVEFGKFTQNSPEKKEVA